MTDERESNYSKNIEYMLQCLGITYTENTYISGKTIPGLFISFSSLKSIRSGKGKTTKSGKVVSEKTLQKIVNAFSLLLVHPEKRRISTDDLDMKPEEFASAFPPSAFIQKMNSHLSINMKLFTNKLYRCYYMMPNSPNKAYLAYFKLIEKDGQYSAYMVRGIQDFSLVPDILNRFSEPEQLEQCIQQKNGGKETESLHLYKAWNDNDRGSRREDITYTKNCITINFQSMEEEPCFSTMYWNICIPVGMQIPSYIGGSALMVDTNDGRRGKKICSFKMGLEAIEDIPDTQLTIVKKGPLVSDSPRLIRELTLEAENGIMELDNSDDNRWYRFIQSDTYREKKYNKYADVNVHELVTSLIKLQADYQKEVSELKRYVEKLKKNDQLNDELI